MILLTGVGALVHAFIYLSLLAAFALSLRPGREAVITQMARSVRGDLTEELITYTRGVTVMWCVFFMAEPLASLVLYLEASRSVWVIFISMMNLPLVAFVFVAEYIYRRIRLRHYSHESLLEMIRLGRTIHQVAFKRSS
jgi:uncharacterized membrane protein